MLIRVALLSVVFGAIAVSAASASPVAQPIVSIPDTHLHTSAGSQTLQVGLLSTMPVTNVIVFCEVSSRDTTEALPFSLIIPSLDGTSAFPFAWTFSKGQKTLLSCDLSYTDPATNASSDAGQFDVMISAGG